MKLYSTANHANRVNFSEAVQQAYPQDQGLFFPETIPQCPADLLAELKHRSFPDMATDLARLWLGDEIPVKVIEEVCQKAFSFPLPLIPMGENIQLLELFQGPTMAFKDFGARFMAGVLRWILRDSKQKLTILTATSGDTGGAVASGFYGVEQVEVIILFPEGKVSPVQRKQLTTLGGNIHSIAIRGNFDDCQRLVKSALIDHDIQASAQFCSANSINIARLLPQSFYYFYGYSRMDPALGPIIATVPSGNFGNLTAGLLAYKMGLPIHSFIAATNENDVIPQFLASGVFKAHPSFETLATAMDVGNPSNFVRMLEIFRDSPITMQELIHGIKVSDPEIRETVRNVFREKGYILDPHTAVGISAFEKMGPQIHPQAQGLALGTAHPAKFPEMLEDLGIQVPLPEQLSSLMHREEKYSQMDPEISQLKEYILSH